MKSLHLLSVLSLNPLHPIVGSVHGFVFDDVFGCGRRIKSKKNFDDRSISIEYVVTHLPLSSQAHNNLKSMIGSVGTYIDTKDETVDPEALMTTTTTAFYNWSFLDSVHLIHCPNGDNSKKRITSTRCILNQVNLLDRLTMKLFDTDDEDRIRGCYNSHVSVFKDILQKQSTAPTKNDRKIFFSPSFDKISSMFFNNLDKTQSNKCIDTSNTGIHVIFEDNLYLNGDDNLSQESIDALSNFIERQNDDNSEHCWDVIHLSYIPYVPDLQVFKTNDKNIVRLSTKSNQSALGTTAYIINNRAMKRIVDRDNELGFTIPIPDTMAELFPETRYALNPTMFVRAPVIPSLGMCQKFCIEGS